MSRARELGIWEASAAAEREVDVNVVCEEEKATPAKLDTMP